MKKIVIIQGGRRIKQQDVHAKNRDAYVGRFFVRVFL